MARIAGVNLPLEKRIAIGLTYIYGVGRSRAAQVLRQAKVNPDARVKALAADEVERIRSVLERNHRVEGDLRGATSQNIKHLKDIGAYRGLRHIKNLPVRGQRTRTNARTKRGKRKTMGSGRRTLEKT